MKRIRCYSELARRETFEDRFEYLNLQGQVAETTFGFDRWLNQEFYASRWWQHARSAVIVRDMGCDLGIPGMEIHRGLLIHHMNPITKADIVSGAEWIVDPEYLICTCKRTHNAIHYGDRTLISQPLRERGPGDTRLW